MASVDLAELFYKQKGRCYWCKRPMSLDGRNEGASATRDHLIPRSRGGKNFMRVPGSKKNRKRCNVVAACRDCNSCRGNMDGHVFRSTMRPHVAAP